MATADENIENEAEADVKTMDEFMEIFLKSMDGEHMVVIDSMVKTKSKDPRFPLDINQCAIYASIRGNASVLSKLLTLRPQVNHGDSQNRRAIHYAAKNGHLECVRLLLKAGAVSNCTDMLGRTPLHLACSMGHIDVVSLLIQQCAHINSCRSETGENALHVTATTSYTQVMELLLDHGGDINTPTRKGTGKETPLHKAVVADKPEMVDLLCRRGARLDIPDEYVKYPLHVACEKGFMRCISLLIQHGASMEVTDSHWQTPLSAAVVENQTKVAKLLVDSGANVHGLDQYGFTPLHKVSLRNNLELIDHLVEAGADVNVFTPSTLQTPLMSAVSVGKLEAVRKLISHGACVNQRDKNQYTALHHVHLKLGGERAYKVMEALLQGGGRLDERDDRNLTPLQRGLVTGVLRRSHSLPCIQLLCQAGSVLGPDEYSMGKKSPLFWLAYSGCLKEALYLVRAGWDLSEETWIVLPGKDDAQDRLHQFMISTFKTVPSLLASCRKVLPPARGRKGIRAMLLSNENEIVESLDGRWKEALRCHLVEVRNYREILSTIDSLPIPIPLKCYLKLQDIDTEDKSPLEVSSPVGESQA